MHYGKIIDKSSTIRKLYKVEFVKEKTLIEEWLYSKVDCKINDNVIITEEDGVLMVDFINKIK